MKTEIEPLHPDTQRLQRFQRDMLEKDRRIRELEAVLAAGASRCPMCGTQVLMNHA